MKNKLKNVQGLRALAAILVVGMHMYAIETKYSGSETLLSSFMKVGASGVDLFFIISGFIMVTVTTSSAGDYSQRPLRFIYQRGSRIYPLYWFITLATCLAWLLIPGFVRLENVSVAYVVNSFLLIPQQELPLLVVGWSLIYELYFYLVFMLFLALPRKYLRQLITSWLLLVLLGNYTIRQQPELFGPAIKLMCNPLCIEFIAGCYLALLLEQTQRWGKTTFCLGFFLLSAGWSYYYQIEYRGDIYGWERVGLFLPPYLLILYGAVAMEREQNRETPAWCIAIGDASYSLYLTHILVLSTLGRVWEPYNREGLFDNGIVLIAMFLVTVFAGLLCYRLIEKPMLDFTHRLGQRLFAKTPSLTKQSTETAAE
ncbi:MAG: acyltransferase [Pseudomonadales bacterium]|nr:acyltransferase [Pseudomonadales bacterium]